MRDDLDSQIALVPTGRQTGSPVLLRVLYEHVVVFCWLAIDPEETCSEMVGRLVETPPEAAQPRGEVQGAGALG